MDVRPIHLKDIRSGDTFFEDAAGQMVRCVALGACREDAGGYSLRATTPLGEREFYSAKGSKPPRLYVEAPGSTASPPPGGG